MSCAGPQLALGTVQFGLGYGIAGRAEPVPERQVRNILANAAAAGVTRVDTAPGYGDIEQRLAALSGGLGLRFVSKIPALPAALSAAEAVDFALQSAQLSLRRLGVALDTLLLHRGEDLLAPAGEAVWAALERFASAEGIRLGVSCYEVVTLQQLLSSYRIAVAQLPGNAFDQSVTTASPDGVAQVEIHLRSVFLQGLLLLDAQAASARVPAAATALSRWHGWLARRGSDALPAALAIAKGFPHVRYCIVGVDSEEHFKMVLDAWHSANPLSAPELSCADPAVIDPRRWAVSA